MQHFFLLPLYYVQRAPIYPCLSLISNFILILQAKETILAQVDAIKCVYYGKKTRKYAPSSAVDL